MRINHNIPALQALFQYNKTNDNLSKSLERLSSGKRINRASDDAAGLAISNKIDTQIKGLDQAKRNSLDGVSLIQVAEGALGEVTNMLQRIRELAVQASSGTLTPKDRESIQREVDQLSEEMSRVSKDIEFNGMKLLDGSLNRINFSSDPKIASVFSLSDGVPEGQFTFDVTTEAEQSKVEGVATAATISPGTINVNGISIEIEAGDSRDKVWDKIQSAGVSGNYTLSGSITAGEKLTLKNKEYGDKPVALSGDAATLASLGLSTGATVTVGNDVEVAPITDVNSPLYGKKIFTEGNVIEFKGAEGFKLIAENKGKTGVVKVDVLSAGPLDLHIGANKDQRMEVRVPNTSPKALDIENLNFRTADGASSAIGRIDKALDKVSTVRSTLGAYQNRLEYTQNNLLTASENMTASYSRIVDTDMAVEMAQYTQSNVISQAGIAMVSQANQIPEQVLQLLRG